MMSEFLLQLFQEKLKESAKNMETLKNTLYDDDINDEIRKRDLTEEHIVKSRSAQIENYLK